MITSDAQQARTTIRQPMNRVAPIFVSCLLVWYVLLTGLAFACEAADPASAHHGNTATDSPLCFFACQAASASSTALTASPQTPEHFQDSTALYIHQALPPSHSRQLSIRSRGPPSHC